MEKAVDFFYDQLRGIRWGITNCSLIDTIRIPLDGQKVLLSHLAWTSPGKNGQILVNPYEQNHVGLIANTLKQEGFNAYPFSKTTVVVSAPQPCGEERDKVIAHIKKLAEETKISIRNIRKKIRQKAEDVSVIDKELQGLTDKAIAEVEDLATKRVEDLIGHTRNTLQDLGR